MRSDNIITNMNKYYTEEEISFLKENYPTLGCKGCADAIGRTINSVSDKARKLGLKVKCVYYTEKETQFILDNYERWGAAYCGKILNKNSENIGSKARRMGLSALNSIKHPDMCPNFNHKIIDNPTKEFAYALGFIWADGYISNYKSISKGKESESHRIEWQIVKPDADCIIPIFETFSKWSRCYREYHNNPTWQMSSSQVINNRWFYKFLNELGFSPNDKNNGFGSCLEYLPQELHEYFILGFFDGDGHIKYTDESKVVSFTSGIDYNWSSLCNILDGLGIYHIVRKYTHPSKGHKSSKLVIGRKVEIDKFYDKFIKPNLDFGLLRKRPIIK